MNDKQLIFIDEYLNCEVFKTNNNTRSKEFLQDYKAKLEKYLNVENLNLFLEEISDNDEFGFIYKFTYDYFFKNEKLIDNINEELVYIEHQLEREQTSNKLRNIILEEANSTCFFNCNNELFWTNQGRVYLEVHHCIPLSYAKKFGKKGDFKENLIAVCPTCHRRLHYEGNTSFTKQEMYNMMYEYIKEHAKAFELHKFSSFYNEIGR